MSDPNRKAEKAARVAEKASRYATYISELEAQGITFQEFGKIPRLNRDVITASGQMFKATVENDEKHKGEV